MSLPFTFVTFILPAAKKVSSMQAAEFCRSGEPRPKARPLLADRIVSTRAFAAALLVLRRRRKSHSCAGSRSHSRVCVSVFATHSDRACVHALLKPLSGLHAQALRKALLGSQAFAAFHMRVVMSGLQGRVPSLVILKFKQVFGFTVGL